ncbi:MAG: hypothetical protein SOY73_03055 [Blautia sp.]|nr:hypothetical protein [Blautia sp.]MDY3998085.1 hypothetical protein [Blautia sp.]
MANAGRSTTARRNPNIVRNNRGAYVEGNTARRLQEVPARRSYTQHQESARKRVRSSEVPGSSRPSRSDSTSRQLSREAQRNREKAMSMSRGFVIFLAIVSVAVLFVCVYYLQLKSELTARMKTVAALETQLTELKEDNDAYESQVTSNVDLNAIKKIAIGRLGMRYPSDDQKMTYETSQSSYVRQYQDIPDSE